MVKKLLLFSIVIVIGIISLYEVKVRGKSNYSFSAAGIFYGEENEKNEIVIFTSFTCESCKLIFEEIEEPIANAISQGKYKVLIKPTNEAFYYIDKNKYKTYEDLHSLYNEIPEKQEISEDAKSVFKEISDEVNRYNIDSLPTIFVNGKRFSGILKKSQFEKILEENIV